MPEKLLVESDIGTNVAALVDGKVQGDGSELTNLPTAPVTSVDGQTGAVDLSGVYQPLENQRLSTSDSPTFQDVVSGLTKTNEIQNSSGGTQLAVYDGLDSVWNVSANLTGTSGDTLTNPSAGVFTFGGAEVQASQFTGPLVGNADTASKLATPRAINGVNFDGSAPITVPAAGSTLTDTVTVAKGGTGSTTLSANAVLLGNGTSALQTVAPSTSGNVLTSNGTTWQSTAPAAGVSDANPTGTIGLTAVNGSATTYLRSDGAPALSQAIAPTWTGVHTFAPTARSSGSAPFLNITTPADTAQTASTESIGINKTAATRQFATGGFSLQREIVLGAPTYSFVGASTVTTAVNLDVPDPIAGTNATLSGKYGIRVPTILVTGSMWLSQSGSVFLTYAGSNIAQINGRLDVTNVFNSAGTITSTSGDVICSSAGKGLQLKSGTGARAGQATLVAGTVTVTNTTMTAFSAGAGDIITLTRVASGGTIGTAITYTISAGASFTINSDNPLDTSTFSYLITKVN